VFVIISCTNCNKKFDIDSIVIPDDGRLLQCSSCHHKWFFKKEIINKSFDSTKNDAISIRTKIGDNQPKSTQIENSDSRRLLDNQNEKGALIEKNKINEEHVSENIEPSVATFKKKKNYNILELIIIFIITFIAVIIILDTFQNPLSKIIPNIEIILYNLYETVNDVKLFLKDLI
jgi:predicted Zn finger-like uncharacterized protein